MNDRDSTMALVACFVHGNDEAATNMLPTTIEGGREAAADLATFAAALLINWSREVGCQPHELLAEIALGQALDSTTR